MVKQNKASGFHNGHLKGQAAMEFLMTYGFAIFVIVIILAALFFLIPGLINAPEVCLFDKSQFDCQEQSPPAFVANANNQVSTIIKVKNNDNRAVRITRALCTTVPKGDIRKDMGGAVLFGNPDDLDDLGHVVLSPGATTPNAAPWQSFVCTAKDGVTPVTASPGSSFNGNFVIWYRYQDDLPGVPERKAVATITGKVIES